MTLNKNFIGTLLKQREFYIGLFTTTVDEEGRGTELDYEGYERQRLAFGPAIDGTVSNSREIRFEAYTGDVDIKAWGVFMGADLFMFENMQRPKGAKEIIEDFKLDCNLTITLE